MVLIVENDGLNHLNTYITDIYIANHVQKDC